VNRTAPSLARRRRAFWFAPAFVGVCLIVCGTLVIVFPRFLELMVAGGFIFAGLALLGVAMQMKSRVTFRRVDIDGGGPLG
jgi:hypothetical protein